MASIRNAWDLPELRSTTSTSVNSSVGAPRISSVHRTVPWRTASSVWENTQSAPAPSLSVVCGRAMPATQNRPSAVRRISSTRPSTYNCSKPSPSAECGDNAASICGRRNTSRPCGSSKRTSWISTDGINPLERATMEPMRTEIPNALEACCSTQGRNSPIRGTIRKCSPPQTRPSVSQPKASSHKAQRAAEATALSSSDGVGIKSNLVHW